jgi:hypothetical protein
VPKLHFSTCREVDYIIPIKKFKILLHGIVSTPMVTQAEVPRNSALSPVVNGLYKSDVLQTPNIHKNILAEDKSIVSQKANTVMVSGKYSAA